MLLLSPWSQSSFACDGCRSIDGHAGAKRPPTQITSQFHNGVSLHRSIIICTPYHIFTRKQSQDDPYDCSYEQVLLFFSLMSIALATGSPALSKSGAVNWWLTLGEDSEVVILDACCAVEAVNTFRTAFEGPRYTQDGCCQRLQTNLLFDTFSGVLLWPSEDPVYLTKKLLMVGRRCPMKPMISSQRSDVVPVWLVPIALIHRAGCR